MARRNARSVSEAIVKYSGTPVYLGTIDFTATSKTNAQATTPFNAALPGLLGKILMLQPSQDVYILPVDTSTRAITSSNGILLYAGERVTVTMMDMDITDEPGENTPWLAAIRSSADGNLKVWELI